MTPDPLTPVTTADRRAVARLLADRGPVPRDDAPKLLGWTAERWWFAVWGCDEWFELTGRGWVLTAAGRKMLRAPAEAPDE